MFNKNISRETYKNLLSETISNDSNDFLEILIEVIIG